jgi:hypothetical protein
MEKREKWLNYLPSTSLIKSLYTNLNKSHYPRVLVYREMLKAVLNNLARGATGFPPGKTKPAREPHFYHGFPDFMVK